MTDATAPKVEDTVREPPRSGPVGRLNRPARAVIAVIELLVAAASVVAAVLLWRDGIVPIAFPTSSGQVLHSSRLLGSNVGGAVALVTFAAIVVLDALRQLVLAMRTKPRRKEKRELARWRRLESDERGSATLGG